CKHYQQYGTALSALRAEIRLSGVGSRRAERRKDKDEEREADLRARIEAELLASIEAEMQERIARIEAEAYRRARAELASELAAEPAGDQRAEPVLSGTNHDQCAGPDIPPPAPGAAVPPARPGLSGPFHDISGEPEDIDVVIARINGTPVPRRAGTGHDEP
ncbi:MAG TPA: hypothetical protein VK943_15530, partial [Arenibaculum sp.]|nr:hypothetical protein [Arenibaculum sp.]